jgi:uncharacterized membrane protein
MKSRSRTIKASSQGMASGGALLLAFAASLATSGLVLSANANERKTAIITFDVPGAQGTFAYAISPQGAITGDYVDSGGVSHGFVRARDGTFITFDAPGAGTAPGQGTDAFSINPAGTITGYYNDANLLAHGFVRARNGAITAFDAPGASQTFASNINPSGAIAGDYLDASNVYHGFVRAPNGAITTFDAPDAGTGFLQGTLTTTATGLNPAGAVTGYYLDASNVYHGFVRAPNGAITTFEAPGASTGAFEVPLPQASTQRGPSRDTTLTRATSIMASCALLTAPSPRSMFQARAPVFYRAR